MLEGLRQVHTPSKEVNTLLMKCLPFEIHVGQQAMQVYKYNVILKAPIVTAADDIHKLIFRESKT